MVFKKQNENYFKIYKIKWLLRKDNINYFEVKRY